MKIKMLITVLIMGLFLVTFAEEGSAAPVGGGASGPSSGGSVFIPQYVPNVPPPGIWTPQEVADKLKDRVAVNVQEATESSIVFDISPAEGFYGTIETFTNEKQQAAKLALYEKENNSQEVPRWYYEKDNVILSMPGVVPEAIAYLYRDAFYQLSK